MTRIHLVNGFLGSGKTTAIVKAAQQHIARGERGIVTNDRAASGGYRLCTGRALPVVRSLAAASAAPSTSYWMCSPS